MMGRLVTRLGPVVLLSIVSGVLLFLGWLIYWPGLTGAFLFDDYGSLPLLGDYGPIHSFWKVVAWLTSGFTGPTGRPVSLASFLIDTRSWPAAPEVFKQTNVCIHLINGALLAGLSATIARGFGVAQRPALWIGILGAAIWLFHPFWVSTTLYVVQRMAMLAALFVFAGLWAYSHGRIQLLAGRYRPAYVWMSVGLGLGTLLAVLSKENGALLPLFAWVLEGFVFDRNGRALDMHGRGFVWWRRVFIIFPSLLLLGYMIWHLPMLFAPTQAYGRDFTPWQRLLTETRLLWRYLAALWLPGTHLGGLFNDDIRLSYSLLRPLSTLFSVLGLMVVALFAFLSRIYARSLFWRSAGLSVAFFLVGHLLESTWLSLELLFEHRNYLPAGLMFLPLGVFLVEKWRARRVVVVWSVILLIAGLALLTAKRADLWGKPFQQALVWAHEHPDSPRAQSYLANYWSRVGNDPEAARLLDTALKKHPDNLLLVANRAMVGCSTGGMPVSIQNALMRLAGQGRLDLNVTGYQFDRLLMTLDRGCGHLGRSFEHELLDVAMANPHVRHSPGEQRSLLHRRALLWLAQSKPERAYADYLAALHLPDLPPGMRLRFSAELATAKQPQLALNLLNEVRSPLEMIHGWTMPAWHQRWLRHVGFYQDSERHLRQQLRADLAKEKPEQIPQKSEG